MTSAALHDAYAAEYDAQVQAYDCYTIDMMTLCGVLVLIRTALAQIE
jgi:hypothetical protein